MTLPIAVFPSRRPQIVVLGDTEQALRRLGNWAEIDAVADVRVHSQPLNDGPLKHALREADVAVLIRDRTPLSAELLSHLPGLRYVIFTGTRNTTLDYDALAARNIPVSHTQWGPSKDSTCEMPWSLILAAKRQLVQHTAMLRGGRWRSEAALPLASVLRGETLGLVGLGEIGSRVAKIGLAFGMKVLAWSPNLTPERAQVHGVQSVTLEQLLSNSGVVSLHLVPSPTTRHLLNAERMSSMRSDCLLVNTSRSALIDTAALVNALKHGRPGFAALDVFDAEPLTVDSPLFGLSNVLLTPHLGFVTEPVFQRFADDVVGHLQAWLKIQK